MRRSLEIMSFPSSGSSATMVLTLPDRYAWLNRLADLCIRGLLQSILLLVDQLQKAFKAFARCLQQ